MPVSIKRLTLFIALMLVLPLALTGKTVSKSVFTGNLAKWDAFRMEGVIEINYKEIALRKMFVLAKKQDELRFDILDGGIFGMTANPLLTVYLGSSQVVNCAHEQIRDSLRVAIADNKEIISAFLNLPQILSLQYDTIKTKHKYDAGGMIFHFDKKKLLMSSIAVPADQLVLKITYNRKNKPDIITLTQKDQTRMKLMIDTVSYKDVEITVPVAIEAEEAQSIPQEESQDD